MTHERVPGRRIALHVDRQPDGVGVQIGHQLADELPEGGEFLRADRAVDPFGVGYRQITGEGEAQLDGDAVRRREPVAVVRCTAHEGGGAAREPVVAGGDVPGADQPADVHRPWEVREQGVDPGAHGHHGGVDAVRAVVGDDVHPAARRGDDLAHRGVAVQPGSQLLGAGGGGLDRRLGPDDGALAVEDGGVPVREAVLRVTAGEFLAVQYLVIQPVGGAGGEEEAHRRRGGLAHHQASAAASQREAGFALEPVPHPVGEPQQRNVPGVTEVHGAEDAALAPGRATVVPRRVPVVADDLGPAGGQSPHDLAAHAAGTDHGDALRDAHEVAPFTGCGLGFSDVPARWGHRADPFDSGPLGMAFTLDPGEHAGQATLCSASGPYRDDVSREARRPRKVPCPSCHDDVPVRR